MEFSPFYYFYILFNLKDNGKEEKEEKAARESV